MGGLFNGVIPRWGAYSMGLFLGGGLGLFNGVIPRWGAYSMGLFGGGGLSQWGYSEVRAYWRTSIFNFI